MSRTRWLRAAIQPAGWMNWPCHPVPIRSGLPCRLLWSIRPSTPAKPEPKVRPPAGSTSQTRQMPAARGSGRSRKAVKFLLRFGTPTCPRVPKGLAEDHSANPAVRPGDHGSRQDLVSRRSRAWRRPDLLRGTAAQPSWLEPPQRSGRKAAQARSKVPAGREHRSWLAGSIASGTQAAWRPMVMVKGRSG
jgi:hypothetical protein